MREYHQLYTHSKPRKTPYRKPEAIKQLEAMAYNDHYQDSILPVQYRTKFKFRDDTANGLTACICAYLRLNGAFVSRLNNGGIYDRKTGKYRPGTNRRGLPDVLATYKGKSLFIECKFGRDRMSEHQKKIQAEQEQSGGRFFVAHTFTEFISWFDNEIRSNGTNTI